MKKRNSIGKIALLSLALAIVLAAGVFIGQITNRRSDTGTLILSVNPVIRIDYDKSGNVTNVRGGNEDGKAVVASISTLEGQSCVTAVEALITAINDAGYFGGEQKNILIKLENGSFVPSKTFVDDIGNATRSKAQELSINSELITIDQSDYTQKLFGQEYISLDKAKEIAAAHAGVALQNAIFDDRDLDLERGVAVYELEFYADGVEYEYDIDAVSGKILKYKQDDKKVQDPTADTGINNSELITEERAKQIILEHAGVSVENALFREFKLDRDDGRYEYEAEFAVGNVKYEYEINAVSGEIIKHEVEERKTVNTEAPKPEPEPTPVPAPAPDNTVTEKTEYITAQRAKEIAVAHAGVDAQYIECELDREKGRYVYEVDFQVDRYEYEYEIDAISGEILKCEKEFDD